MSGKYAIYEKQNMQKANLKALLVSGIINSLLIVGSFFVPISNKAKFFSTPTIVAIILSGVVSFVMYAWFLERKIWPSLKTKAWIRFRATQTENMITPIIMFLSFAFIGFFGLNDSLSPKTGITQQTYCLIAILWSRRAFCFIFNLPLISLGLNKQVQKMGHNTHLSKVGLDDTSKRNNDYQFFHRPGRY
jgi:hypothetical protein